METVRRINESKDCHFIGVPPCICYCSIFDVLYREGPSKTSLICQLDSRKTVVIADRLNWWCDNECMQRLWPLATTGDGNCLLHAASLAMWGFHDRHLTLRHAVHHRLIHDNLAFHRRWLYQCLNDQKSQGFTLTEDESNQEWSEICNLSFPTPKGSHKPIAFSLNEEDEEYLACCRKDISGVPRCHFLCVAAPSDNIYSSDAANQINESHSSLTRLRSPISSHFSRDNCYDFLEQIHVFVLAQVIRRPIIIISDTFVRDADGQPIQPLSFGGLYLPLLEKPDLCEKTPILLTYSNSHFSALVPMDLSVSFVVLRCWLRYGATRVSWVVLGGLSFHRVF